MDNEKSSPILVALVVAVLTILTAWGNSWAMLIVSADSDHTVPWAIANAAYHATGIRVRDLPITIDKLLGLTPPK